jgi:hypothetical protein
MRAFLLYVGVIGPSCRPEDEQVFVDARSKRAGANPTTASHNASAVKKINATSSLVRFGNKNIFFCNEKRSSKFKVVGLAPDLLRYREKTKPIYL